MGAIAQPVTVPPISTTRRLPSSETTSPLGPNVNSRVFAPLQEMGFAPSHIQLAVSAVGKDTIFISIQDF